MPYKSLLVFTKYSTDI